jgi:glycosyltransferase involved in cell wall biosynthesis
VLVSDTVAGPGEAGPIRVGLDVSPLDQTAAGTARYLAQLEQRIGVELVRLAHHGDGRCATVYRDAVWYPLVLPRLARRARLDVLHCPTFRAPLAPPACPLVVTVHDLAVLRHPETFNLWTRRYSRQCVPRVARAARLVIAVSEHTKRELVELLRTPEEKIRVVLNGVADVFGPDGPAETGDYVLAVGTLEPRKNLVRLAEATRRLGVELRVVGASGWGRVELGGEGVRLLGRISDEELARLYRGARCLAYPSLYEGFGIPIVEAMACGAPVVTSRGGATEEVAGGAAVLVDPLDPASIAAGIEEAAGRQEELVGAGLERARAFSWAETARLTAEVYREAAA